MSKEFAAYCAEARRYSGKRHRGRGRLWSRPAGTDPAVVRRKRSGDAGVHRLGGDRRLRRGETFYTWQGGIPELRQSLARYHQRHFGRAFDADEFIVTGGGMHAIQMAIADHGAGRRSDLPYAGLAELCRRRRVAGARPVAVPLEFSANGWSCDVGTHRGGGQRPHER